METMKSLVIYDKKTKAVVALLDNAEYICEIVLNKKYGAEIITDPNCIVDCGDDGLRFVKSKPKSKIIDIEEVYKRGRRNNGL